MPPIDDPRSEDAETVRAAEHTPGLPPGDSGPTFPAEAESLLQHLKRGAARANSASPPSPGAFPAIANYEVECEIGRGGMGVVYRARHAALHHTVAVKMILAAARAAPGEVARFLAEAEAVAAVKHPNVVRVYDLGHSDERPYFVMEYVEGGNLANRLKGGRLTPRSAAELLEPVARGVQAAHDAGIVHRDLKPANILLAVECGPKAAGSENDRISALSRPTTHFPPPPPTPKVSDFGLAKRLSVDLTRSQAVMGTPQYMAPEQAGGKAKFVGPGADVYALGVILYECLTGAVPFESDDTWSLIRRVLEDAPEPVRKRVPDVPRDLELICLRCLEKEPHHRYPTAAALADDLKRFLNDEPVSVRPIGPATRATRWMKRRPAAAGLVALAALVTLVVPPVLVGVQWRLDQRAADTVRAGEREEAARTLAGAAQKAEDEAKRAEREARRAEGEANRLAEARDLFALRSALLNRAFARPLGWTAANRADLARAVARAGGDREVLLELRSAAACGVLAADLFPADPVATDLTGSALATDPKTGLVAVGEFKSWGACRVLLFDPATGRTVRRLAYPTEWLIEGQDGTRALAFGPDGRRLFVGTRGSKVVRFDLDNPSNKPARVWSASAGPVEQLAVSPDGKTVYGLCRPEVPVFAWDAETGKPREPFVPNENVAVKSFDILPSGDLLAGNGHALYRWTAERKLVSAVTNKTCFRLAATAGPLLLLADGPRLAVHDLGTGEPTDRFADPALRLSAHEEFVRTIVVHPSGAFAATAAGDVDRTVKVWELASGKLVGTVLAPGTETIAVAWSGDGRFLVATAAGRVERWAFAPGDAQRFACTSGFPLSAAALGPDDRVAAVGPHTNGWHDVFLGAPGSPPEVVRLPDAGGRGRVGAAVAPDGTLAVTLHQPGLFLWKPGSPIPAPAFTRQFGWCPRFGPDGALWALVDSKEVGRFDPATKAQCAKWRNSLGVVISGLSSLDALAVGRTVAVAGGREGAAFLLDPVTCEPITTFRAPGDPILAVALVRDESLFVAGTQTGKLRVVRLADRTELPALPAHPGGVTALSINRDGTLLATGGRDRTVRLWVRAGDRFEPLLAASHLPGLVRDLQFSATGDRLLVLLDHDHAVRVWDVQQLKAQLVERKLGW